MVDTRFPPGSRVEWRSYSPKLKGATQRGTVEKNNRVTAKVRLDIPSGPIMHAMMPYELLSRATTDEITKQNVLAALPGNWSDVLVYMGYESPHPPERELAVQTILKELVDAAEVRVEQLPAEDPVYLER